MPEGGTVPVKVNVDDDDPCGTPDRGWAPGGLPTLGVPASGVFLRGGRQGEGSIRPAWVVWTKGASADLPRHWGQRLRLQSL